MVAAIGAHIPSDCRLSDLEAELEKLTMNAWRAPEMVGATHLANKRAQLSRDLRSANTVARPPAPIRSKSAAVPPNDRLWPDNRNRAENGGQTSDRAKQTEIDRYCSGAAGAILDPFWTHPLQIQLSV